MIRIFGHFISLRAVLIATFELAAILAVYDLSTMITLSLVYDSVQQQIYGEGPIQLLLCLFFWMTAASCGMYSAETIADVRDLTGRLLAVSVIAYFVTSMAISVMEYLLTNTVNLKLYYAINLGASACYFWLALLFRLNVFSRKVGGTALEHRVVVLGIDELAAKIARLGAAATSPYNIVAFVPLSNGQLHADVDQGRVVSGIQLEQPKALLDLAQQRNINEVVLASHERRGMPVDALMACKLDGLIVTNFSDFWERQAGQIDLDSLSPGGVIFSTGFRISWPGAVLKRLFDILVGTLLLIITFPICVVTAIVIKLDSPGPIFYEQERVGLHRRPFQILKFRSMRQDAEKGGTAVWAQKQDPRVTRVGNFIRRTRIDEIPQVINVLAGEMSFVGPRPERPVFVEELIKKIPFYDVRHQLKPGITGWAQINLPYGASDEDAKAKLAFDLYYVKNWNLFLDIVILFQTVQVVLWRLGSR
jgi:sugar transferase (PEP-CTERM system associated)